VGSERIQLRWLDWRLALLRLLHPIKLAVNTFEPSMPKLRWRQLWNRAKLGLWLPFILVGLIFLVGTDWVTTHVTSGAYETTAQLQTDEQPEVQLSFSVKIVAIDAEIDRRADVTEVTIRTTDSILRELQLDLPVLEFAQIEDALIQELQLPRELIKQLIRYRVY
jgi:hypothetical protein